MIYLYQNRSPKQGPWGGGVHAVRAIEQYGFTNGFVVKTRDDVSDIDVLLAMGLDSEDGHPNIESMIKYKQDARARKVKLFLRVNDCDKRKNTNNVDNRIFDAAAYCDGIIFVSEWMYEYFGSHDSGRCLPHNIPTTVIVNGVDHSIFKPGVKINNGKTNIVSHHWSDNPRKSGSLTKRLDEFVGQNSDKFTFTFIGRTNVDLQHAIIIAPLYGQALGDELGKYDFYFSESQFDPGPNHAIESISCNLPTYVHKDGGGCVEFAGPHHVYNDWHQLEQLLLAGNFMSNDTSFYGWDQFTKHIFDFIRSV